MAQRATSRRRSASRALPNGARRHGPVSEPSSRESCCPPNKLSRAPAKAGISIKQLVELKARYEDLGKARALLSGSTRLGRFRQVDTYLSVGDRRLKVRRTEDHREGQLIYYERADEHGVKESRVDLASLPDAGAVLDILRRVLPTVVEVRKTREIYHHQGVQVHLDEVERLGRFIEFEKVVDASEIDEGRRQLESLRTYFQIPEEDLMASSYSDLLEGRS